MDGTLALKKYDVIERIEKLEEGSGYELPIASADTLGGVKIGDNLEIDESGVLSAGGGVVNYSTSEQATGQKWIDGKELYSRTFTFTPPKGASVDNTLLCDKGDIDTFFIKDGFTKWSYYEMSSPLTISSFNNMYCMCGLVVIDGKIYAHTTAHNNVSRMTLTMYYTKNVVTAKKKSSKKTEEQ